MSAFKASDWERLPNLHCPQCGSQSVWHESEPGDYYVGETFCCTACEAIGHMWDSLSGAYPDIDFDELRKTTT